MVFRNPENWFSYNKFVCFFLFSGDPAGAVCPSGTFKCPEGKCIPSLWVCNYQKDCEKGEDEFQSCRKYCLHEKFNLRTKR